MAIDSVLLGRCEQLTLGERAFNIVVSIVVALALLALCQYVWRKIKGNE